MDAVSDASAKAEGVFSDYMSAQVNYDAEKVWFPWLVDAERNERIAELKAKRDELKPKADAAELEVLTAEREANKELGLFSPYGVRMAKQRFWDAFEQAKVIGRRRTFIDGLFAIITSRDREAMEIVTQLATYLVLNMGSAMFLLFWVFAFTLPRLIWSFGAGWFESIAFFVLAMVGAYSVMISFLAILTAAAGGTVFGLAAVSGRLHRLQGGPGDDRQRLEGQPVPGYTTTRIGNEYYYRPVRGAAQGAGEQPAGQEPAGEQRPGFADAPHRFRASSSMSNQTQQSDGGW